MTPSFGLSSRTRTSISESIGNSTVEVAPATLLVYVVPTMLAVAPAFASPAANESAASVAASTPVRWFNRRFVPISPCIRSRFTAGLKSRPKYVPLTAPPNGPAPTSVACPEMVSIA